MSFRPRIADAFDLQKLEERRLLAVTTGPDGYITVTPSADSRIVYVSSSLGNDNNDGLSPSTPVRTIQKAGSLIRNRMPDQILLRRGDTFFGGIGSWRASGRAAQEPMVLGAYGSGARPRIFSERFDGLSITGPSSMTVRHLYVMGLEFHANTYDGRNGSPAGIRMVMTGSNLHIEDCVIRGYKDNIAIGSPSTPVDNVKLRKNVITDAYAISVGHAQGFYASGSTTNILMDGNLFDHNGWNPNISGAVPTVFNHNVYLQTGHGNVIARNNIFANGSLHGAMIREGGTVQNNLFVGNAIGLGIFGGNQTLVTGNVVLNGRDLPTIPHGIGFNSEGYGGSLFFDNIVAHDRSNTTTNASAFNLNWQSSSVALNSNIVYNWRRALRNGSAGPTWVNSNHMQTTMGDRVLVDHRVTPDGVKYDYSKNTYHSPRSIWHDIKTTPTTFASWRTRMDEKDAIPQQVTYLDPNRDVGRYNTTLGGSNSTSAFLAEARKMSRTNPQTAYTAAPVIGYIRQGFGLAPTPSTNFPTIPAPGTPWDPGTTNPGGGTTNPGGGTTNPGGGGTGGGTPNTPNNPTNPTTPGTPTTPGGGVLPNDYNPRDPRNIGTNSGGGGIAALSVAAPGSMPRVGPVFAPSLPPSPFGGSVIGGSDDDSLFSLL